MDTDCRWDSRLHFIHSVFPGLRFINDELLSCCAIQNTLYIIPVPVCEQDFFSQVLQIQRSALSRPIYQQYLATSVIPISPMVIKFESKCLIDFLGNGSLYTKFAQCVKYKCVCVCIFMYMCVYVCMYVYIYIYMCVCVCMYVCVYIYTYIYIYICMCVCVCVCVYVYTHTNLNQKIFLIQLCSGNCQQIKSYAYNRYVRPDSRFIVVATLTLHVTESVNYMNLIRSKD